MLRCAFPAAHACRPLLAFGRQVWQQCQHDHSAAAACLAAHLSVASVDHALSRFKRHLGNAQGKQRAAVVIHLCAYHVRRSFQPFLQLCVQAILKNARQVEHEQGCDQCQVCAVADFAHLFRERL